MRRKALRKARPNGAHRALARLARSADDFLVATQNVDDLHERGGVPSWRVVHVHGTLRRDRCMCCGYKRLARRGSVGTPRCPRCADFLRPDVVWFDEELDPRAVDRVNCFIDRARVDLVLVIGTHATFDYIREWAGRAQRRGALLVEVNPRSSRLTRSADLVLRGRAADVLPGLLRGVPRRRV